MVTRWSHNVTRQRPLNMSSNRVGGNENAASNSLQGCCCRSYFVGSVHVVVVVTAIVTSIVVGVVVDVDTLWVSNLVQVQQYCLCCFS